MSGPPGPPELFHASTLAALAHGGGRAPGTRRRCRWRGGSTSVGLRVACGARPGERLADAATRRFDAEHRNVEATVVGFWTRPDARPALGRRGLRCGRGGP